MPLRLRARVCRLARARARRLGCGSLDCGPEIDGELPAPSLRETALWPRESRFKSRASSRSAAPTPSKTSGSPSSPAPPSNGATTAPRPPRDDPDGTRISDEFRDRLEMAWLFLAQGTVRFVLVSGGAVDPAIAPTTSRPPAVALTSSPTHASAWVGEAPLAEHIFVDPLAEHSTTNVRNADKLSVDLGLSRNLIVTTLPARSGLAAAGLTARRATISSSME
jgi:hypothetical protein